MSASCQAHLLSSKLRDGFLRHGDMGMVTEGDNWGERYNYGHARAKTCMDERPRTWCKEIRVEKNR